MSNSYIKETTIIDASTGKYETGTTGTYTVATKTLALQTPSANITSSDIGKTVVFRISTSIYIGIIDTIVSTSSFTVTGHSLPSSNGTLGDVLIAGTTVTNNIINLSSLRIMRAGAQIKLELSSTEATTVRAVTKREIDTFNSSATHNLKTILWALVGDEIHMIFGDSLTTGGTIKLRYPSVPDLVDADTDYVDLPDGLPIQLAIIYLKGLIQQRLEIPKDPMDEKKIQILIENLLRTFAGEVNAEVVKEKVLALK